MSNIVLYDDEGNIVFDNTWAGVDACDDDEWPTNLGIGSAFTLTELDWERGERRPPWRKTLDGFAPPSGPSRIVVASVYRRRSEPRG